VHAYLERSLDEKAGAVAVRLYQDGKDEAQQWGPGMALIWPNGKALKLSLRKDDRITVAANGNEQMPANITTRAPLELTVSWNEKAISVQAAGPAMGDLAEEIATFPRAQFPGAPSLVKLGKMPNSADAKDHGDAGPVGFSRIEWFRIHER
jgi:antitoxin component of MazEF toxin-antitoxin module